jgi:putative DNA primase/helicase
MSTDSIQPAEIEVALNHISPDLPRDEWARVAMAIKSELGDQGAQLFDEWSARGANYDKRATRDTWRSVKATGPVRIGTLIHLARQHGYKRPAAVRVGAGRSAPRASETAAAAAAADAERQRRGAQAAQKLWASGAESGACAYLTRKGVGAHGVRYTKTGDLLVPMRDAESQLLNVQTIRGELPQSDAPSKLFARGARKSGLWHTITGDNPEDGTLLICEGYATGATLREASGRRVVVAFDCGNLIHVARELRRLHPHARIVIAGDDDRDTAARTGRNPGREKAEAAARAVRGLAIFPQGLTSGSDFNDLAASEGLHAVRAQVDAALQAAEASGEGVTLDRSEKIDPEPDTQVDRFSVGDDGVWFAPPDSGDGGSHPVRVCGQLRALALARDAHDGSGALLLEFARV